MDKETVKLLLENGVVVACEIIEDSSRRKGWLIQLRQKNGASFILSDSRRKGDKWFGKLDTAARTVREIGFTNFSVSMPTPAKARAIPKPEDFELDE